VKEGKGMRVNGKVNSKFAHSRYKLEKSVYTCHNPNALYNMKSDQDTQIDV